MKVIFYAQGKDFVGKPVDEVERDTLVAELNLLGARLGRQDPPYTTDSKENLEATLEYLGIVSIFGVDTFLNEVLDVDSGMFRLVCYTG